MTITKQEAFDRVLAHLREQGKPAFRPETGICLYRTPEGLKCGIGGLIADEDYFDNLEGNAASVKCVYSLFDGNPSDYIFYGELQNSLHDNITQSYNFLEALETKALAFAKKYGLEYKPC